LQDYSEFRHLVAPELRPADRILELGCGNSGLGSALAADGFQHVTCTDLSQVVVERMQRKAAAAASPVQYQVRHEVPCVLSSIKVVSPCILRHNVLLSALLSTPAASETPPCAWLQAADMLQLPFPDGSFDVVIEKGALEVSMAGSLTLVLATLSCHFHSTRPLKSLQNC
jgi:SAM-dependent methyltransferase